MDSSAEKEVFRFSNRKAIVTGGAIGIAKEATRQLLLGGASVLIVVDGGMTLQFNVEL